MFAKITLFSAILTVAYCGKMTGGGSNGIGSGGARPGPGITSPGGNSESYKRLNKETGTFMFGYDIVDPIGAQNAREETTDSFGNKVGSYRIQDADGRIRVVNYVADENGFRATIDTNEAGTSHEDAAFAVYKGPDPLRISHPLPAHGGGNGGGKGGKKWQ